MDSAPVRTAAAAFAVLFLGASGAGAEGLRAESGRLRGEAELGYETGIWAAPRYWHVGAGAAVAATRGVELSSGARLGLGGTLPSSSIAGFLRANLVATAGSYRPAIGTELEATSATDARPGPDNPPGSMARDYTARNGDNWLRLAVLASPARWQWEHLLLGIGSFKLGTPLSGQTGERVYLTLSFVTLGYTP
jgi:hypothetical protein